MPNLVVVVCADPERLRGTEAVLSAAGDYVVAPVSSYTMARNLVLSAHPDLLITDAHVGEFDGLHLATCGRLYNANLSVIVTHPNDDAALQDEVSRLGAVFVGGPVTAETLQPPVDRLMAMRAAALNTARQWPRKRASSATTARAGAFAARIFDLSYGGARVEFIDTDEVPEHFDLAVPYAGVTVQAQRVWSSVAPTSRTFWCGAEVVSSESWRLFVDSIH